MFLHRLGKIRDHSYDNQRYRASGLNLVIAAVTLYGVPRVYRARRCITENSSEDASTVASLTADDVRTSEAM
jgi:TnpA family transposase